MASGKKWNRLELLIILNLYHKLNFGQFHSSNPVIITIAEKLERTTSSVSMKLCNMASLDPALKIRGIIGLKGASKLDKLVWDEFHETLNESVLESENAVRELLNIDKGCVLEVLPKVGLLPLKKQSIESTETKALVNMRLGQNYFRNAVLNNFAERCGVSQLPIRQLLVASHILPWSSHKSERLNVCNGLCLSRLYDAAFDCGLITFDDNLKLMISSKLKSVINDISVTRNFGDYVGEQLVLPKDAVCPRTVV